MCARCRPRSALSTMAITCFFVQDASGSQRASDHAAAIERLRMNSVQVVTTEMVMFEWLKRADAPEFRELLKIVKSV